MINTSVYGVVHWSEEADWGITDLFPTLAEAAKHCTTAADYVFAAQGNARPLSKEEEQELAALRKDTGGAHE